MPTVEQVVAALQKMKARKAELATEVKALDAKVDKLHTWLLGRLLEHGLASMSVVLPDGRKFSVQQRVATTYNIADDEALRAFVKDTGRIDVFQRRISGATVDELKEAGVVVPGLNSYAETKVSVVKR